MLQRLAPTVSGTRGDEGADVRIRSGPTRWTNSGGCRGEHVTRRHFRLAVTVAVTIVVATAGLIVRNQLKVQRGREMRAALMRQRHPAEAQSAEMRQHREALFRMLQPVTLANCELERFGETNDGGYLMCG